MRDRSLRVLRLYHSAVVNGFRARDHHLRELGVEEVLLSPERWNEGGRDVYLDLAPAEASWVHQARTWGRHPYRFVYDPVALFRRLDRTIDLIDIHEEPASLATGEILLARLLRRLRTPVVLYSAQNLMKRYPPPFRWIERWALRTATAVYCCNTEAAEVLRRKGFGGKTIVLGLGVDLTKFAAEEEHTPASPARVGYVGRLERHKGVHVLLEAMSLMEQKATLAIVGAGPEDQRLRGKTSGLGLEDRVTFTDFVDYEQLPAVYRGLDVLVVPSLPTSSWREQFCRVAVEAMACGVPVIASDDGALAEVVGPAGVLTAPGDARALASALDDLLRDRELWSRHAEAGPQWAQRFGWPAISERHYELYLEAVS